MDFRDYLQGPWDHGPQFKYNLPAATSMFPSRRNWIEGATSSYNPPRDLRGTNNYDFIFRLRPPGERAIPGHALHEKGSQRQIGVGTPVESKTRTYHGRVGSGRTAGRRGGARQDGTPTEQFAQETSVPRTPQGVEDTSPERPPRSTNKQNPM